MTEAPLNSELSLTAEQMRDIGHQVVEVIITQFETVRDQPALTKSPRQAMEQLFREPPPAPGIAPGDFNAILDRLTNEVFHHYAPLDHPRFFGFVPSPINFISVMAEALAAAFNPFMGSWLVSSGPTQIELVTIDWLLDMCGFPASSGDTKVSGGGGGGGLFVSGGSMANFNALATARQIKLQGDMTSAIAYCSDQAHSSMDRAMRLLGFRPEQLRHIESDEHFRLSPDALQAAIVRDREQGLRPFCLIASAGTTNTGAIDPLSQLADLCAKHDLWLHVDGAYGAPTLLTEQGKEKLAGIDRADSITMDPHKWLFQPYEIGCLLVRDRTHLLKTFHVFKDYMRDAVGAETEVNLRDYGLQLTRNFRALKLWMSIQYFGLDAFRAAITNGLHLAEYAQRLLCDEDHKNHWEIVTPASIGIISFRHLPQGIDAKDEHAIDAFNLALIDRMYASGYAMVSSTTLRDRPVLRLCPINPRTTEADIEGTIAKFELLAGAINT